MVILAKGAGANCWLNWCDLTALVSPGWCMWLSGHLCYADFLQKQFTKPSIQLQYNLQKLLKYM